MKFRYVAYTLDQGIVKGQLEARDEYEARIAVEGDGLRLLRIGVASGLPGMEALFPSLYKVSTGELIRFTRQLATMLASGSNLLRTLEMLERESSNRVMRRTVAAIRDTLDEGGSLSDALSQHPKTFNALFVSVVEVGEYSGRLSSALDQMADILEKDHEAKQRAIRTLMYPVAIMGLSVITLTVLLLVAMPPLLKVFEQMDSEIPLMTQIMLSTVQAVQDNFIIISASVLAAVVGIALLRRIPRVLYQMDATLLRAPLLGPFILAGEISRFSRTIAMLLDAGVSLAHAVQLGRSGAKNQEIKQAFLDAEDSLLSGHGLIEALRSYSVFPNMFVELIMLGEESNSLQRTMNDAANAYQKQLEQRLDSFLAMLEPASTVFVGGIVGLIAFSMFVPIYSGLNAVP